MTYRVPTQEPDGIVAMAQPIKPRSKARRYVGIGAGVLAVAVAVTGSVMAPGIIQANQATHYSELAAELTTTFEQTAQAQTDADNAVALTGLLIERAEVHAGDLVKLAAAPAGVIADDVAAALLKSSEQLVENIEGVHLSQEELLIVEAARKQLDDEKQAAEKAAELAKVAGKAEPAVEAVAEPAFSFVLAESHRPRTFTVVPSADVTGEIVEAIQSVVDAAQPVLATAVKASAAANKRETNVAQLIAATLPALTDAAEAAPAAAKKLAAKYPEAAEVLTDAAITAAAFSAAETFKMVNGKVIPAKPEDKDGFVIREASKAVLLAEKVDIYVAAAAGAKAAHDTADTKKAADAAAAEVEVAAFTSGAGGNVRGALRTLLHMVRPSEMDGLV